MQSLGGFAYSADFDQQFKQAQLSDAQPLDGRLTALRPFGYSVHVITNGERHEMFGVQ